MLINRADSGFYCTLKVKLRFLEEAQFHTLLFVPYQNVHNSMFALIS